MAPDSGVLGERMGPDSGVLGERMGPDSGVLGERNAPNTGDHSEPIVWAGMAIFALGIMFVAVKEIKKSKM